MSACEVKCRKRLLKHFRKQGIEATVTTAPPIIRTGYAALDLRCPHGVQWFAEPTSEQRAKWIREGTA